MSPEAPVRRERVAANAAVTWAMRSGALPRPRQCEACGTRKPRTGFGRFVYHHWSYAPEHRLDVIPLCLGCHMRVHYGTLPEPRTGRIYERYRRGDERLGLDVALAVRRRARSEEAP